MRRLKALLRCIVCGLPLLLSLLMLASVVHIWTSSLEDPRRTETALQPLGNAPVSVPAFIKDPNMPFGANPPECLRQGTLMDYPMSTREQELRRIYAIVDTVMRKLGLTYWPADGTLLGILRHGRVSTDHDLDFHILLGSRNCRSVLRSVAREISKLAKISFSGIANKKGSKKKKYSMFMSIKFVRMFSSRITGPDFWCVYNFSRNALGIFTSAQKIAFLPQSTLPLIPCRVYDMTVKCPGGGDALLALFKPGYYGCMVFPHCFGDAETSHRFCRAPHPPVALEAFINATMTLERCKYANLAEHFRTDPSCAMLLSERRDKGCCDPVNCTVYDNNRYCFFQHFNG